MGEKIIHLNSKCTSCFLPISGSVYLFLFFFFLFCYSYHLSSLSCHILNLWIPSFPQFYFDLFPQLSELLLHLYPSVLYCFSFISTYHDSFSFTFYTVFPTFSSLPPSLCFSLPLHQSFTQAQSHIQMDL